MDKIERYLNDAKFHNLVESLEKLVADEAFTLQDISDALDIAAQHSVQRTGLTPGFYNVTCPSCGFIVVARDIAHAPRS